MRLVVLHEAINPRKREQLIRFWINQTEEFKTWPNAAENDTCRRLANGYIDLAIEADPKKGNHNTILWILRQDSHISHQQSNFGYLPKQSSKLISDYQALKKTRKWKEHILNPPRLDFNVYDAFNKFTDLYSVKKLSMGSAAFYNELHKYKSLYQ